MVITIPGLQDFILPARQLWRLVDLQAYAVACRMGEILR